MSLIDEARTVRQRVAARLRELEPLVREYEELRVVAAELGIDEHEPAAPARRSVGRRGRSSRRAAPASAPGDADAPEELSHRVLAAVRADPGQTVTDYARALELAPTALYRPVRELTTAGAIIKRARQLYPASPR